MGGRSICTIDTSVPVIYSCLPFVFVWQAGWTHWFDLSVSSRCHDPYFLRHGQSISIFLSSSLQLSISNKLSYLSQTVRELSAPHHFIAKRVSFSVEGLEKRIRREVYQLSGALGQGCDLRCTNLIYLNPILIPTGERSSKQIRNMVYGVSSMKQKKRWSLQRTK